MAGPYTKTASGKEYRFSGDEFTEDDFTEAPTPVFNTEDWTTVARLPVSRGQAVAFGVGDDGSPMNAEGRIYADLKAKDGNDADSDPDTFEGAFRFVLLNPNNEPQGEISRHKASRTRAGDATASGRKDRKPYPKQPVGTTGQPEVGFPYKVGLQVRASANYSGDNTFSLSDSELIADGYTGTQQG